MRHEHIVGRLQHLRSLMESATGSTMAANAQAQLMQTELSTIKECPAAPPAPHTAQAAVEDSSEARAAAAAKQALDERLGDPRTSAAELREALVLTQHATSRYSDFATRHHTALAHVCAPLAAQAVNGAVEQIEAQNKRLALPDAARAALDAVDVYVSARTAAIQQGGEAAREALTQGSAMRVAEGVATAAKELQLAVQHVQAAVNAERRQPALGPAYLARLLSRLERVTTLPQPTNVTDETAGDGAGDTANPLHAAEVSMNPTPGPEGEETKVHGGNVETRLTPPARLLAQQVLERMEQALLASANAASSTPDDGDNPGDVPGLASARGSALCAVALQLVTACRSVWRHHAATLLDQPDVAKWQQAVAWCAAALDAHGSIEQWKRAAQGRINNLRSHALASMTRQQAAQQAGLQEAVTAMEEVVSRHAEQVALYELLRNKVDAAVATWVPDREATAASDAAAGSSVTGAVVALTLLAQVCGTDLPLVRPRPGVVTESTEDRDDGNAALAVMSTATREQAAAARAAMLNSEHERGAAMMHAAHQAVT